MVKYFYNTTGESGATLGGFSLIAEDQERMVLDFIRKNPDTPFTSEDVAILFPPQTPITSIRRAVCNLKQMGEIKVVGKKIGMFKRPIFVYEYNKPKEVEHVSIPVKCEPIQIGGATITEYNEHNPHEYVKNLQTLDEKKLYDVCKDMIWFSAYAANRPSSDFHWMCDACFYECRRRGLDELYQQAHTAISRSV
jgi:hypothetical protein